MTPENLGIFVLVCITLIPAVQAIRQWSGKGESRTITPQPLEVVEAPDYVKRADCLRSHEADKAERLVILNSLKAREQTLDTTLREMDVRHTARTEKLRGEFKNDMRGVHERVDEVLRAVSRVEGKLDR